MFLFRIVILSVFLLTQLWTTVSPPDANKSIDKQIDEWVGTDVVPAMAKVLFYSLGQRKIVEAHRDSNSEQILFLVHFLKNEKDILAWQNQDNQMSLLMVLPRDLEKVQSLLLEQDIAIESLSVTKRQGGIPLIILILVFGGIFYTFRYNFVNIKLFHHAIAVIRGKYDNPNDKGEISHFKALTSALSATVGLGNIAGVAIAIVAGGPGAIFWMWLVAIFGMSMKFSSATLSQLYRRVDKNGNVLGGPMVYLEEGIKEVIPSMKILAKFFAILFAIFTVGGAIGAGNLFQSNQTFAVFNAVFFSDSTSSTEYFKWIFGLIMAVLVASVIIGGIRRIGDITSRLVPAMVVFYVSVCLIVIISHITKIPHLLHLIISEAFSGSAVYGGVLGVMIQGMKRASFSNEAGLGSAAIAHSAAKTNEPVREGVVAMIGPFIDTIVICTMTALTLLITGVLDRANIDGAVGTVFAFESVHFSLKYFLAIAVFIFAYSTIISWSYYGEKAIQYLGGSKAKGWILFYRIVFILFVILGPVISLKNVIDFSDLLVLSMAFPNILGMVILSGKVKEQLKDYIARYKAKEFEVYK